MKFGKLEHFYTGVAIPVSALRSDDCCGSGEFADLKLLGKWCKSIGIEIIQILPVNDTGKNNSPYSAISSMALHPIFIRLQEIPEAKQYLSEIDQLRQKHEKNPRLDYDSVLEGKLSILEKCFENNKESIIHSKEINQWIESNSWIKPYAVFFLYKKKYNFYHWKFWPTLRQPSKKEIINEWNNNTDNSYFYAWIQYHLELQLNDASKHLEEMGVYLKGDIPILINEDSVDIWMYRKYFDLTYRAGAPPDMFSHLGQNWDFPVFNWDTLKKDDYSWWRMRLRQAAKFYHAYRIDHVLGFFRIYRISSTESSGKMGHFYPASYITKDKLHTAGFDDGRIRWMSLPHISGEEIDFLADEHSNRLKKTYLNQIENENLYNLKPEYESEKVIEGLTEEQKIKNLLLNWHRNRTLIEIEPGVYHKLWDYKDTSAYKSLNSTEKDNLEQLFLKEDKNSEKIWTKKGTTLLSMMQETTAMLMCAEDLGAVPQCVPNVLKKLQILSLKIERWTRKYDEPGQPYISTKKYPRLSVCTPSVHDTSSLRGWWELELGDEEKEQFFSLLKLKTDCPEEYSLDLARAIIVRNLSANSIITIFQIQDLFSLYPELKILNPSDERINIPGTISNQNWSFKIYTSLEFLISFNKYNEFLWELIEKRKNRPITEGKHYS